MEERMIQQWISYIAKLYTVCQYRTLNVTY